MIVEFRIFEMIYMKTVDCVRAIGSGNHLHARREVDNLRQLRASFARFSSRSEDRENNEARIAPLVASLRVVAKAINANLDAIERLYAELLDDLPPVHQETEGWHRVLDRLLPLQWSWEEDILLLSDEPDAAFRQVLRDRGQRRVIFLSSGPILRDEVGVVDGTYFVPFGDKLSLDKAFSEWLLTPPALITQFDLGSGNRVDLSGPSQIIQKMVDTVAAERNTNLAYGRLWIKQQFENSQAVLRGHTHAELLELLSGKDIIVISPGPSLRKNISLLANAKGSAILLAVAQACPALKKHGIAPDLVLFSDPSDCVSLIDDFIVENAFGIILNSACHPNFFKRGFKRLFPIISAINVSGIEKSFPQEKFEIFGGSVSVNAVSLCVSACAKSVALVGQDLSFGSNLYYDRPGSPVITSMDAETGFAVIGGCRHRIFSLKGYYGGLVFTKPDYWIYHSQLEELALNSSHGVSFFNCTEGGAHIEGFKSTALSNYVDGLQGQFSPLCLSDVSDFEYKRRVAHLQNLYEEQVLKLREIGSECMQILFLLNSNSASNYFDEISSREISLMAKISPVLPLHFIMQQSLLRFEFLIGQSEILEDNMTNSKDLYQSILRNCGELEEYISAHIPQVSC